MNSTITIEFSDEALAAIRELSAALAAFSSAAPKAQAPVYKVLDKVVTPEGVSVVAAPVEVNPTAAAAQETASAATAASLSEPAVEAPVTKWTLGEIRKRVMDLGRVNDDLKKAAKALVNEYAPKVTEIPVEKYDEFMKKLEALYVKPAE